MEKHPDMVSADKKAEATKKFQEITAAYQVGREKGIPLFFFNIQCEC